MTKTQTTELPLLSRIKTLTDEIIGFFDDNALPDAAGIYLPRKTGAKEKLEAIIAKALAHEQHMRSLSFKARQEDGGVRSVAWRPIETAPKDGTVIDLIVNGKRMPDCYWSHSTNADGSLHETAYDCWAKEGQFCGMGGIYPVGIDGKPTHWMEKPNVP